MKPALSIIFFTVSSGAGLGLLALIALADLFGSEALSPRPLWRAAALALAMIAAGLTTSLLHLANPRNAWRSFSRFRSSWLSREAVFAVALFPVALAYIALTASDAAAPWRAVAALAMLLLAWAVLFCTAMIYASLKPIRQWHTRLTPINYLLLGHWSGAVLLAMFACAYTSAPYPFLMLALVFGLAALVAKLAYWQVIGDAAQAPTLARAIGVHNGVHGPGPMSVAHARLLDTGHSHATFLTNEFGFTLARRHVRALRIIAVALGFALPLLWLIGGSKRWQVALAAAMVCIMGLLTERWLFFAEARHTVRLYHGDART